ncbi:MAG: dephospho-CoA kinase [Cyclonatronaceae bacterium]
MLHIGVTGGIGSGKSTFLHVWEKHGVPVVYADDLAKELMVSDPALRQQIVKLFGPKAYLDDGSLNRKYLAKEAFGKNRLQELNDAVHPAVYKEIAARKDKAAGQGHLLFAHESALLPDSDHRSMCDAIILLTCPAVERIRRVTERDGTDPENVGERIQKQPAYEKMATEADIVIHNDGSPEMLQRKAESLLKELKAISQSQSSSSNH